MSTISSPGVMQVAALPISSSGSGNSAAASQLNNVTVNLAGASIQADADSMYDPKVISGKPSVIRSEGFCSSSHSSMIMVVGILCIVYGVIAK